MAATDSKAARSARRAPVVLVVEDDPAVRALAVGCLRDSGYQVLEADSGQRALMLFEATAELDLIFTGIRLPGLDGFKLADMAKFKRPDIRIVYATEHRETAADTLGIVHGAILEKPYRPAELARTVRDSLR